ncbi:preprotein translocase subunit SecE [Mesoplasma photuris]|uniref:preprotein translocase subunit SecE n=1 Tax=Mesoplasma photuris TaxID=217731 RepID=UPI000689D19E|nr:preprotein translocase subunit SecE [Mesoplasma photuris]
MSEKVSKSELKAKAKFEKLEQKRLQKEQKIASGKKQKISSDATAKIKEIKKPKEKRNWKLEFKEFPIKMVKEVGKIKWSGSDNLTRKYITVLIFMLLFAVVFIFVDWGLQELLTLIKVV